MDYKASVIKGLLIGMSIFIGYKTFENLYNYNYTKYKDENSDETIYIKEDYFISSKDPITSKLKDFTKIFD